MCVCVCVCVYVCVCGLCVWCVCGLCVCVVCVCLCVCSILHVTSRRLCNLSGTHQLSGSIDSSKGIGNESRERITGCGHSALHF